MLTSLPSLRNPMCFKTDRFASVSLSHVVLWDAGRMSAPGMPGLIGYADSSFFLRVGSVDDVDRDSQLLRDFGMSDAFVDIMAELAHQSVPFVCFSKDGEEVVGAPVFVW